MTRTKQLLTATAAGLLAASALMAGGPGEFKFDEDNFFTLEESGVAIIRVERSRGEDGAASVDYMATSGSAVAGEDFTAVSGTLTWGNGDGSDRTFNVPILDDALAEGAETILLELSNPTGGAILNPERFMSVLTIQASDGGTGGGGGVGGGGGDDPGVIKFDEISFEVLEEAGVALVTVERSQGEDGAVSVDYSTSDGSATAGADYTAVTGTLTWVHNDGTDKTFTVPILDDNLAEGVESINLSLSNVTGGATLDPLRDTSVINIQPSDGGSGGGGAGGGGGGVGGDPGVIKFDELTFEVFEEAGFALITVERSQGEDGVVSVDYNTSDGTAVEGEDYVGTAGTLTWANGDGSDKTFTVALLDDLLTEGDETVHLTLSNVSGGAVIDGFRGESDLVILASDGGTGGGGAGGGGGGGGGDRPGTLKFGSSAFQVLEQGGVAIITVERSQGETGAVSVDYTTFDGTAVDGQDYTGVSGTLAWPDGDGSNRTFMVPILDDELIEGNETLELRISNPTGGALLDPQRDRATLTIVENDNSTCAAGPGTMCLLGGRFQARVDFTDFQGNRRTALPAPLSNGDGLFSFHRPGDYTMLFRVVNRCSDLGQYRIFFATTSPLEVDITVRDMATGTTQVYSKPFGVEGFTDRDYETFTACP